MMVLIRGLNQWKMKDKLHVPITTCLYVIVETETLCYCGEKVTCVHLVGVDYLFSLFLLNIYRKMNENK